MGIRESFINFLRDLKFYLSIYTWVETWIMVAYALAITGAWVLFAYALSLPNPLRFIVIWALILTLAILTPKVLTSIQKKK